MSASPARTFASPLFPHPPRFLPMRVAGQPVELSYVDVGPRDAALQFATRSLSFFRSA